MPRLLGVDIPGKKQSRFALRYIHGIGPRRADDVLAACSIEPSKKADDLTQDEIHAITTFIQDHYRVEGDLRREVSQNIRRLISIGSTPATFIVTMILARPKTLCMGNSATRWSTIRLSFRSATVKVSFW